MTKNFKGGYKIVSLNGNDLASGDSFVVNGLYENLVNSYKKPILVTEIVIDGEKQQDSFAVVKQSDGGYKIDVYDYALTVTSEDSVSAVALPEITSIGDGLDLTDGELSATGGVILYEHHIYFNGNAGAYLLRYYIKIISSSATAITGSSYQPIIDLIGNNTIIANGYEKDSSNGISIYSAKFDSSTSVSVTGFTSSFDPSTKSGIGFVSFTDTVIQIQ